jgi:hypothetical protein
MSHDRRTRRALLVAVYAACAIASTGCLRLAVPRSAVAPVAGTPPAPTAGPSAAPPYDVIPPPAASPPRPATATSQAEPLVVPPLPPAVPHPAHPAASAPGESQPESAPDQSQPRPESAPNQSQSPTPPPSAPDEAQVEFSPVKTQAAGATAAQDDKPSPAPTPLLDAAFQRVEAVTRLQREWLNSSLTEAGPADGRSKPSPKDSPAVTSVSPAAGASEPTRRTVATQSVDLPGVSESASNGQPSSPLLLPCPTPERDRGPGSPGHGPAKPSDAHPAASMPEDRGALLTITELRLCRKVFGFASFEALDEPTVKAGQRVLIYCEMTGIEYEPQDGSFVSRLSSVIELRSAGQDHGALQWEQELGTAEDVCRRRRRDYYVNYRVTLPRTLAPGSYRLRLIQTDLVANQTTSAEMPLAIAR